MQATSTSTLRLRRHPNRAAAAVVVAVVVAALLTAALPAAAQNQARLCPGDCRGRGMVAVSDLALGVRIVLGLDPLSACPAMDPMGTGQLFVNQLIRAVSSVLFGCGELIQDTLTDFDVIDLGLAGALRLGSPPPPSGGPTIIVPPAATVPGGIVAGVPVQTSAPIKRVFLAIDNAFGYYEVELPEPRNVIPADVAFALSPPRTRFDCLFSVADEQGNVGTIGVTSITIARPLVQEFISSVRPSTGQAVVTLVDGVPPPPTGGPMAMAPGNTQPILPGVTLTFAVQADIAWSSLVLSVEGASGYFQIDLPTPATRRLFDVTLNMTVPPMVPPDDPQGLNRYFILSRVILPDGRVGTPDDTRITLVVD